MDGCEITITLISSTGIISSIITRIRNRTKILSLQSAAKVGSLDSIDTTWVLYTYGNLSTIEYLLDNMSSITNWQNESYKQATDMVGWIYNLEKDGYTRFGSLRPELDKLVLAIKTNDITRALSIIGEISGMITGIMSIYSESTPQ